jgi:hypothetical protein
VQLRATFADAAAVGDIDSLNDALVELKSRFGKSELEVQGEAFAAWRDDHCLPNGCTPTGPRCIELTTDDLLDMDVVCNEVRDAVRTWRDSAGSKGMLPPKIGAFHTNVATGVSSLSRRAASFSKIVRHAAGSVNGCLLVVPGVGLRAISWPIVLLPELDASTAQKLRDKLETAALEGCRAAAGGAGNSAQVCTPLPPALSLDFCQCHGDLFSLVVSLVVPLVVSLCVLGAVCVLC